MIWSKSSLLRDFTLLAALIVFVLMLASLWVTYETYLDQSERIVHGLETEATRVDRAMIIEIEHASYLLEALGQQITHMKVDDLSSIALLLRSFDTAATAHHVFSWIDENQNNVVSSNKGVHPKPIDVSDRDFVKKALAEPWKIQIGRPIEGRVSEKWVLPIALGLTDTTGKYIGTILISMDIDTVTRDLRKAVKESGSTFEIYSSTLLPLTTSTEANPPLEPYSKQLKLLDFARSPSGILARGSPFNDRSMYVYYEVSANYPYIIVLGMDSQASDTSIRNLLVPRLAEIFLIGVFMLALLWIVRLRVIRPVDELSDVVESILRDEPYRPLQGTNAGEVIALSGQIKKLSDYLKEMRRVAEEQETKNVMLRKAKEAAEFSNKIKTEFLTAMSHELRTPLNTIAGFSEIIKDQIRGPLENASYRQYGRDIHEAARHLQSLIDDVLALSNAESSMAELQEKSVDIRFVLNKCVRLVTERLQEQKLHLEVKMPDVTPRLRIDELRLKQIIINLILNAASHSEEESNITVEAYLQKDKQENEVLCISFTTSDTRPSKGKSQVKGDLGSLGIPLTKALVAMHQGTLDIENVRGKPKTAILRFPQERIVH